MRLHRCILVAFTAALFAVPSANVSGNVILLDFTTLNNPRVGGVIDESNPTIESLPFVVDTLNDLVITFEDLTGVGDGANLNSSNAAFGVNSDGSDSAARFDADLGESVTISFDRDLEINRIDFD